MVNEYSYTYILINVFISSGEVELMDIWLNFVKFLFPGKL